MIFYFIIYKFKKLRLIELDLRKLSYGYIELDYSKVVVYIVLT